MLDVASPPAASAAGGDVSLPSVRSILRIFTRPEGARERCAYRDFHRVYFADGPWCMHVTGLTLIRIRIDDI